MKSIFNQKIVDAHHHFWDFDDNKHSWLKTSENKNFHQSYLPDDLVEDSSDLKLIKTIHITCEIDKDYILYETEWLQKISDSREDKFPNGIIARIDLSNSDIQQTIENHKKFKNFRGFRQILRFNDKIKASSDAKIDYLKNEIWIRNMSYIEKYNLIFELLFYYSQFEDASKLINKYQNIKFIINHTLFPYEVDNSNFEIWQKSINQLSNFSNVYIKLSGFGECFPNWSIDSIRPFIDYTFNKFGIDRCIFASNFPVDKFISSSSYLDYWQSYFEIMKDLNSNELDKLFYQNAEIFYEI